MKDALKIGWGIVNGFVVWVLRYIHKGLGCFNWYDDSDEALMKAKFKAQATNPSVVLYFWDPW